MKKGEPVQFSVESLSRSASLNSRTDAVSVTLQTRGTILLMNSGETERYDHKVRLAGGRDLDAGGALPAGVSLSAGVERAKARTGVAEGTLDISSLGKPPITYLLTGTAQLRVNSTRATVPVNGSLVLNADRTYILGSDGDEVPETGVWFKGGKGLVLFQQNLLEQLEVVREIYAQPPGKPLEINVTRLRNSVRLNQKTDTLSLRSEIRMNLFYPQKGSQVALSISASLLGTLAFP